MAPAPEYDKEPKAPDKSVSYFSCDEKKPLLPVSDQQSNLDHKSATATSSTEVENNKDVEHLDDGQLRALLDEAITYKRPKDREGKSSLFNELLEEVEQDEQALEAAARELSGGRGTRGRGARSRRPLPHSNSLQNLEQEARIAEARGALRRVRHAPAPAVSARATHGGSLPSDVDKSFLVGEDAGVLCGAGGYLATVRCVNPPPLHQRRVSASDAHPPNDTEMLNRRSKPPFPMTYTARATLEIGGSSVSSGRAVTTTTASNQVRNPRRLTAAPKTRLERTSVATHSPPRRNRQILQRHVTENVQINKEVVNTKQVKLLNALQPKRSHLKRSDDFTGPTQTMEHKKNAPTKLKQSETLSQNEGKPRGPRKYSREDVQRLQELSVGTPETSKGTTDISYKAWSNKINCWYEEFDKHSSFYAIKKDMPRQFLTPHYAAQNSVAKFTSNNHNVVDKCPYNPIHSINTQSKHNNLFLPKNFMQDPINKSDKLCFHDIYNENNHQVNPNQLNRRLLSDKELTETEVLARKQFKQRLGKKLVSPTLADINPRNIRNMSIGKPSESQLLVLNSNLSCKKENTIPVENNVLHTKITDSLQKIDEENLNSPEDCKTMQHNDDNAQRKLMCDISDSQEFEMVTVDTDSDNKEKLSFEKSTDISALTLDRVSEHGKEIELGTKNELEIYFNEPSSFNENNFVNDLIELRDLSKHKCYDNNDDNCVNEMEYVDSSNNSNHHKNRSLSGYFDDQLKLLNALKSDNEQTVNSRIQIKNSGQFFESKTNDVYDVVDKAKASQNISKNSVFEEQSCLSGNTDNANKLVLCQSDSALEMSNTAVVQQSHKQYALAELPNNAFDFLTHLNSLPLLLSNDQLSNTALCIAGENIAPKKKPEKCEPSKKKERLNKNSLRVILLKKLKNETDGQTKSLDKEVIPAIAKKEVDSAIPFNCITSSEVVDSCNTTSSTSQSVVAEDPKSRSAICSSYNGLQLARTNYGSTSSTAPEEYKVPIFTVHYRLQKSLDENGNAVQGYSSPHSGSSQHKKPRRKKSSKNETVITSHQIDGYKGDKDLNEVLRFIESHAEQGRGHKLPRKHHHDDDKGKKRSAERRKDKDKPKRASSLEELSRTKLEDLTDKPATDRWADDAPKPERRSWGDDARDSFYYRDDTAVPDAPPDTDFQTVTKKRKPRRRADEHERDSGGGELPPPRPPEPRARRVSAPPSDRSNDSNDDMDSVHSLPSMPARAPPPPPAPPAPISYADIARTRHNIPDLIESCNFYAEGDPASGETRRTADPPGPAAVDTDGYPALEPRSLSARRVRDKPALPQPPRPRDRKERATEVPRAAECPAPDVVADRRPPVILLDSTTRPRDMDGVTFGFDINEQLLGGGGRRGRCDLVRSAVEPGARGAVPAGCGLRYLPPRPAPHSHHLLQIVDYVGAAWDDVVRSGNGKVRYFSE